MFASHAGRIIIQKQDPVKVEMTLADGETIYSA